MFLMFMIITTYTISSVLILGASIRLAKQLEGGGGDGDGESTATNDNTININNKAEDTAKNNAGQLKSW